jgi:hypothetical protein
MRLDINWNVRLLESDYEIVNFEGPIGKGDDGRTDYCKDAHVDGEYKHVWTQMEYNTSIPRLLPSDVDVDNSFAIENDNDIIRDVSGLISL